jgi:hypothetical protein
MHALELARGRGDAERARTERILVGSQLDHVARGEPHTRSDLLDRRARLIGLDALDARRDEGHASRQLAFAFAEDVEVEPDEDEPDDEVLPEALLPPPELSPEDFDSPDAFESPDDLLSLELFASEPSDLADADPLLLLSSEPLPDAEPGLPYRSAYQPPPFNKKPVPPETKRLAFLAPHDTHFSSARSLIDCSASHWWPQASHTYS